MISMNANDTANTIRAEYNRLDRITGVDTSRVEIKLSSRLSRRLGYFSVTRQNLLARPQLSITISTKIVTDEELFLDVIRHEYAHAVCYLRYPHQKHGHDMVWKNICREVGCTPRATRKVQ